MSLSGSRGLVRISRNPTCQRQAAMVAAHVKELEFFRQMTGRPFQGEYGERTSARRRGDAFERAAYGNDAAQLKQALGPRLGHDPDAMWVRNLADEAPGPAHEMRAARLSRTHKVMRDLAAGGRVPELLVQPQLRVPVRPDVGYFEHVVPDFMVLDAAVGMYLPGELKSFQERDGVADRADLDLPRRQAGVQVAALRALAERVGLGQRVAERAVFVFATPYGLRLGPPHLEDIPAECRETRRAIAVLADVHARLAALNAVEDTALVNLVDEFAADFQEVCHGTCILAGDCKAAAAGSARELGDRAALAFGSDMPVERLVALAAGATPHSALEREVAPALCDAAGVLDALAARHARRAA
jgi:hypothetical protein